MKQSISDLLRQITQPTEQIYSVVAKVISVDADAHTADVCPLSGDAEIYDVRLGCGGDYGLEILPAVGAVCVVTFISATDTYMAMVSDVQCYNLKSGDMSMQVSADGVVFNGGKNGGMVMIKELKEALDSIKKQVDAIHSAIPAALSAVGAGAAANGATGAAQYNSAMAGKVIQIKDMEDTNIKH